MRQIDTINSVLWNKLQERCNEVLSIYGNYQHESFSYGSPIQFFETETKLLEKMLLTRKNPKYAERAAHIDALAKALWRGNYIDRYHYDKHKKVDLEWRKYDIDPYCTDIFIATEDYYRNTIYNYR